MANFTPGPWVVIEFKDSQRIQVDRKHPRTLLFEAIMQGGDERGCEEARANAKLAAAAPDMYEALEHLYELHASGKFALRDEDYGAIAKAAAALNKAEGGGE